MSGETFAIGQLAELKGAFTDLTGTPVDPSTVTFRIQEPDGTITSYVYGTDAELKRDSAGVYYVDWPIAQNGRHWYEFESTGTGQAAAQDYVLGLASHIG